MPKPAHVPTEETRRLVESLAGVGLPQQMICHVIGIRKKDTLEKHYRDELDRGRAKACAQVGKKLFEKCMAGDTASILFWCKTQMGFRESKEIEVIERKAEPIIIIDAVTDADTTN